MDRIATNDADLTVADLTEELLGVAGYVALADALMQNSTLTDLNLCSSDIADFLFIFTSLFGTSEIAQNTIDLREDALEYKLALEGN